MSKERWIWLAVFALLAIGVYRWDVSANRRYGALAQRAQQLQDENRNWRRLTESLGTSLRTQTVTVNRTLVRRETVLDSILRVDTLVLTRRESVLVAVADTVIRACTEALNTCAELVRAKDRVIANRESTITLERKLRPSFGDKLRSALVFAAAGYLVAKVSP